MKEKQTEMENENGVFAPEQYKQLKEQGWIDEQGKITSQSISILACLEADRLYQAISDYYPNSMQVISRYAERFLDEQNFPALLSLLKETYELAELEEPDYMKDFCEQSTITATFLQELTDDWIDSAFQDVD